MAPSYKLSPTWPSPRVRDSSPRVVAVVALLHLAVTAVANLTSGWEDDDIGGWIWLTVLSAAVAVLVWIVLAVHLDAGRPGWKRLPRHARVDPDSLPRRRLRWWWLLWYVPLWSVVTFCSLLLTPGQDDPLADLVFLTLGSGLLQLIGALLALVAAGLVVMPVVLLVVGARRLRDGEGLPPTGPVLLATGTALLVVVPWAVGMTSLGRPTPWEDDPAFWPAVTIAASAVLVVSLLFVAAYGLLVRDREARRSTTATAAGPPSA